MIWADFGDPGADLPLQNLCNCLGFPSSGQVVRGRCVRRGISAFSKKFIGIVGGCVNSHNFIIFTRKMLNSYRNRASEPFRIADIP